MLEKKNLLVNCALCDTRSMKEEDYSHFEKIVINTDMVLVNTNSKSILSRLPVSINQDRMIELSDNVDVHVKTVNGSYTITGSSMVSDHTLMIVNGSLTIEPGTEAVLEKYEQIVVNGSVTCPKSLEGYLGKLSVNGSITSYPDGCIILKENFVMDKYFPLRAKENAKYFAEENVLVKDEGVDVGKMVSKNVQFFTEVVILPENKVEECASIFDEKAEFVVVPEGMKLIDGDVTLDEKLLRREGNRLFVYGDLEVSEKADMEVIADLLEKLIVKGKISIKNEQLEAFNRIDAEYEKLDIRDNRYLIKNVVKAKIDRAILESCEEGIRVCNAAKVVIKEDVDCALILEKLRVVNCAKISCSKEQESAVAAISTNVAKIGDEEEEGTGVENIFGMLRSAADTKMVNADEYVM